MPEAVPLLVRGRRVAFVLYAGVLHVAQFLAQIVLDARFAHHGGGVVGFGRFGTGASDVDPERSEVATIHRTTFFQVAHEAVDQAVHAVLDVTAGE